MKKMNFFSLLILLLVFNPYAFTANVDKQDKAQMEVVFVLDATGSMSGLIQTAKEKIWSIATSFTQSDPAPELKFGLVVYRDKGDVFVTKTVELSEDIDHLYKELMNINATGGGDGPESVNQGLYEAVAEMDWSQSGKVYKAVFLVGDYPPHMDYRDDVKYPATCKIANRKSIIINTIQMGTYGPTTPIWKEIARTTNGTFFQVGYSANGFIVSTPYDVDLANKSKELDATRIFYGTHAEIKKAEEKVEDESEIYSKATVSSIARRAIYNTSESGAKNLSGGNELITDLINDEIELDDLDESLLPEEMKVLKPEELKKVVDEKIVARNKIVEEIKALQQKRDNYITEKMKKSPVESTFSDDVYEAVKEQAAPVGIQLKGSAKH